MSNLPQVLSHDRSPYAGTSRPRNRCPQEFDVHGYLNGQIYGQGSDNDGTYKDYGINSPIQITQNMSGGNRKVGFEDIELYFDSTRRDGTSNLNNGEIRWSVPNLNNNQDIRSCIEIKLSAFAFPRIPTASTIPDFFYFRTVLAEFVEAPTTQGILGPSNNRFHFEFAVEQINGQAVRLVPTKDAFFFRQPITSVTDFTLRFMVPPTTSQASVLKRIPIPNDTVQIISLLTGGIGYNPIRFQITSGGTTNTLGLVGALTAPGVAVYISEFDSTSAAVNAAVTSTNGVFVTNIIDDTTFEIAGIDSSALVAQFTGRMYIPKNRVAIPIRFTSVVDKQTNYIDVAHL